ncbi:MAG: hypothetical protein E7J63_05390 [Pantoea sp.]|uniref:hypothetical protein n=1 Tax=Pantoea sp. TaxID=69393 RepID=UPI002908F8A2|nr:hypothetical protein [Pantoea sp.]MDU7837737.1 hypothetical protein [Pantoea sp.]
MTYSSETICAISGAALHNLKRWTRSGFIHKHASGHDWTAAQLQEVMDMTRLTSQGATIREIKTAQASAHPVRTGGWAARRGDMLWQLEFGSEQSLAVLLRKLGSNFTGDDFVIRLLAPLHQWLRDDTRTGACRRMERFHHLIVAYAGNMTRNATRAAAIPLLLENVSEQNQTDIWLEAIRLSGQGFSVEVRAFSAIYQPATAHQHHLYWCGAGLTEMMYQHYLARLNYGHPVLLCGPDRRVHHLYPQISAVA